MSRFYCVLFIALIATMAIQAEPTYSSPLSMVVSKDSKTLYVAEETASRIALCDLATNKVKSKITLPANPSGLAIFPDGKTLVATIGITDGKLLFINTATGKITKSISLGHSPMAPVVAPDQKTIYVCSRFLNAISVIDLQTSTVTKRINVIREPVAAVITQDGKSLFVANHLPAGAANVERMTSHVDVIDTATHKVTNSIQLPNGAIDLRGMHLGPEGRIVYVPSILARFLVPTTQIERGWINTHALNLIDAKTKKLKYTVLLDDVDQGAANPWGVTCTPDNKYICVAHSATHEVSLIERAKLMEKLQKLPGHDTSKLPMEEYEALPENPANNLSFLSGMRRRIMLKGYNPRGIVAVGNKLYVSEYITDTIGTVDAETGKVSQFRIAPKQEMTRVRKGEFYFNDAGLCFQKWQSCSTCHPDVRTDAVNWDLLNDGIGNPKSTKSLLFTHKTPPVMITGIRPKAEIAVRAGIKYIQFAVPEEEKATALDEFLKSLEAIPSPYLVDGKLSAKAVRGKKTFKDSGCASCHSGHYYTDMEKYDVGTGDGMEKEVEFDTPGLREVWRTAPYLYDGRAATLKDAFRRFNKDDNHGMTSNLSDEQLEELIEYIKSL